MKEKSRKKELELKTKNLSINNIPLYQQRAEDAVKMVTPLGVREGRGGKRTIDDSNGDGLHCEVTFGPV
jgi:hypothetical protein